MWQIPSFPTFFCPSTDFTEEQETLLSVELDLDFPSLLLHTESRSCLQCEPLE